MPAETQSTIHEPTHAATPPPDASARRSPARRWLILALAHALSACGAGADGADPAPQTPPADPVAATLTGLGVDTTATKRLDDRSEALPDDYSPLGATADFIASRELLVLGAPLQAAGGDLAVVEQVPDQLDGEGRQGYDTEVLFAPAAAMPWAAAGAGAAVRAAARADLDGDGLDELAIVYWDAAAGAVQVARFEDRAAAFAASAPVAVSRTAPREIAVESGDLDGDGRGDLVIALSDATGAHVIFVRGVDGALVPDPAVVTLAQSVAGSETSVALATGNLDNDPAHEVIAVLNEFKEQANAPAIGTARYTVFDRVDGATAVVAAGQVRAAADGLHRAAMTADVALGDVDGDNVDEAIFGGLSHFDPDRDCDYQYLLVALDDLAHELAPLGATEQDVDLGAPCRAEAPLELRYVHVNVVDLDGDGHREIQANQLLYDDFVAAPPFTRLDGVEIDPRRLFAFRDGYTGRFDRHTSAMVAGDLTADGREDLTFYAQGSHRLETWGIGEPDEAWRQLTSIALAAPASEAPVAPVLLAPNVDHDSLVLSYDAGEHRLVFTEPVVIAALAAAPCHRDLGQDLSRCRTEYGTAKSESVQTEDTSTVTAGATVGAQNKFGLFGAEVGLEVLARVQARASRVTSRAYTLTKRIVYVTGPIEDTVVFTTIPYDQYTYTVRSHPDPEMIGARLVVSLPRSPIELQVSRDFYNEHVIDGPLIDEAIFSHRAGDARSYPSAADKDRLLASHDGFFIGPQAVGQGTGIQTLSINVFEASGGGSSWGVDFSLDLKATVGTTILGFSVGGGVGHSLQIMHGKESSYVGSVTNLPADRFAEHGYRFGLFTYVHEDPGSARQFEVVNYWIE